jgi:predicted anti-sigma-YlaC factor YlaD
MADWARWLQRRRITRLEDDPSLLPALALVIVVLVPTGRFLFPRETLWVCPMASDPARYEALDHAITMYLYLLAGALACGITTLIISRRYIWPAVSAGGLLLVLGLVIAAEGYGAHSDQLARQLVAASEPCSMPDRHVVGRHWFGWNPLWP